MMYRKVYATTRNTNTATLIESFLDDNAEYISQHLWDLLEEVAETIDYEVQEMQDKINALEEQVYELESELNDLQV